MMRVIPRAFLAALAGLAALLYHPGASQYGTAAYAAADVKVGPGFYETIAAGFSAIGQDDVLQLRSTDFFSPLTLNRPVTFTLRGGHDADFATVTGVSNLYGTMTISEGKVNFENIVLVGTPPPILGSSGAFSTGNLSPSGASLKLTTASGSGCADDIYYRVYYSDSHSLSTVADMEAYGIPDGDFSPAVIGRVAGKVSGGLNFSGSDYVDAGNGGGLNFGAGDFSVEAWVNPSSWSETAGIIGKGASSDGESGYTLRLIKIGSDNYFQFVIGNGIQQVAAYKKGYTENNWYHLVGITDRTSNVLKLYVNGALAASTSLSGFNGNTDAAVNLTIGKQYLSITQQNLFFSGMIDEAAVYSRALSATEIADRYNAGAGRSVEALGGLVAGWRFDETGGTTAADVSGGGHAGGLHFSSTIDVSGLVSLSNYSLNVMVMDNCGNKSAYSPVTVKTPILPISFNGSVVPYNLYMPAVGDLNNDGFIEALGTFNDGNGNLVTASASSMGLQRLFAPGRVNRTCSMADFNGDFLPDIVCNVFSAYEPYTGTDPVCQAMTAGTPYSPNSVAMLFFNNGNGTFTESTAFTDKQMRGLHGETILIADFNNDGYLDIFLPHATFCSPNEQNYLLINDGLGNFTEVADEAGVSVRNRNIHLRGEGAQAVDFNNDGWIDFYIGSHLFISNGIQDGKLTFTDRRELYGLPEAFDEGFKFTDWNNDGYLDMVIHHPTTGPAIYKFNGTSFSYENIIPTFTFSESYGLNVFDMNNDGREDIIVAGGTNVANVPNPTVVYLNKGASFERSNPTPIDAWGQDTISFGDINGDGKLDILKRLYGNEVGLGYYRNTTSVPDNSFFRIKVVDSAGQQNQQGRGVRIYPQNHPGVVFTRIVDSGSGYLTQSPYDIFVGTPYPESHRVEVYFKDGMRSFMVNPGERKRVFSDGRTENY